MTTAAEKMATATEAVPATPAERPADKRRALGRGLDSLLPGGPRMVTAAAPGASAPASEDHGGIVAEIQAAAAPRDAVMQIRLDRIDPNPYQTRISFDQDALEELADSIKANGVVQPIVVRPGEEGRYILVLGERRCRASKHAGMETIPAIVRRVSDQHAAEMTVVENLQRADLNCMEQASAFSKLSKQFNLTQTQIGERVGLSRESVANYMRLLRLPGTVMQYLMTGLLGFTEARELLRLEQNDIIERVAKEVVEKKMSYFALQEWVDKLVIDITTPLPEQPKTGGARWVDPNVRAAQQELQRVLGLRVKISDRNGKGKIVIEYGSVDDYERVVGMLRGR